MQALRLFIEKKNLGYERLLQQYFDYWEQKMEGIKHQTWVLFDAGEKKGVFLGHSGEMVW